MAGSPKSSVIAKGHHFIYGAVLFLAVCSSIVPLCSAGTDTGKRPKDGYNEFDTLLTVMAVLLCIGGIFVCAWCTCCGHHDYLTILDQRRFQQQVLDSDTVWLLFSGIRCLLSYHQRRITVWTAEITTMLMYFRCKIIGTTRHSYKP